MSFLEAFDWSRYILLPFRKITNQKELVRRTHYPLTVKVDENSAASLSSIHNANSIETKSSRNSYRRIRNPDSLFMIESDDNFLVKKQTTRDFTVGVGNLCFVRFSGVFFLLF